MSEFKGNKGPWACAFDYDNHDRIVIYSDEGIQPHICYTPEYSCDDDLANANAQLISAAPELLEALQKVYKLAKQIGLAEDLDFEEYDYMGAAINKALSK